MTLLTFSHAKVYPDQNRSSFVSDRPDADGVMIEIKLMIQELLEISMKRFEKVYIQHIYVLFIQFKE